MSPLKTALRFRWKPESAPGDRRYVTKAIARHRTWGVVEVTRHNHTARLDVRVFLRMNPSPRYAHTRPNPYIGPRTRSKKLKDGPLKDAIVMQYLIWRSTNPHGR